MPENETTLDAQDIQGNIVPENETTLDAQDIQGNIVPGFRRAQQWLVSFSGADPVVLRRALQVIAPSITPLERVLNYRDARKEVYLGRAEAVPETGLWLNFAIGPRAASALGLADTLNALDGAFAAGMVPGRTGDSRREVLADGTLNPAAPANWVVGGPHRPLDLLLIFAADRDIEVAGAVIVEAVVSCGMSKIHSDIGQLLPDDKEHFGFKDGVSVPGMLGILEVDGGRRHLTTRYGVPDQNGVAFGKPGQPLADTGQFLFDTGAIRNGSFLVFRRLMQDVRAFYADTADLANTLSHSLAKSVSDDLVRASIVGRWPSGQPLMRPVPNPQQPESDMAINYFDFANSLPDLVLTTGETVAGAQGDPQVANGGRCPIWAHIRKVNPRDLPTNKGGPDESRSFQMLRRGIPFGPRYNHAQPNATENRAERGLLFVAYQSKISTQFEELNSDWMNTDINPSPGGFDLLVGQKLAADGENSGKPANWFDAPTGSITAIETPRQWVIPTGGAYLFAPSISWTNAIRPDD